MFQRLEIRDLEGSGKFLPKYNSYLDAGMDCYSIEDVVITNGHYEVINLGFATSFPSNFVAILKDRSSMAGKGLHVIGGVIDSSYRGEWKVMLVNFGADYVIKRGDKIVQALFLPIFHMNISIVNALPDSVRGTGGFGSTGR